MKYLQTSFAPKWLNVMHLITSFIICEVFLSNYTKIKCIHIFITPYTYIQTSHKWVAYTMWYSCVTALSNTVHTVWTIPFTYYQEKHSSVLDNTSLSYKLSHEYWVVRNRYSRLLFTSEDRLWPIHVRKNNQRLWRHNANTPSWHDITDQLWWLHNAKSEKTVLGYNGEISDR